MPKLPDDSLRPVPCDGCLVYAMCKSRLNQYSIAKETAYVRVVLLSRSCELLYKYITPDDHYDYRLGRRQKAVEFLTGIKL